MHLIGKQAISDNSRICDLHFSEEAFKTKRIDGKRKLKPNAAPNLSQESLCQCVSEDIQVSENVTVLESGQDDVHDVTVMESEKSPGSDGEDNFEPNVNSLLSSTPSYDGQEQLIDNLRAHLKKALRERNMYKRELENVLKNLDNCFNEDQMHYMKHGNARGHLWCENTMSKALKLYVSCGAKGYEEIRRQHIPLPSIRTIQYRIRNIQLNPGILEDIFKMLTHKVAMFREAEKHAALLVDEMAIQPGLQIDSSTGTTLGRPTMKNAAGGYNNYATHALVFMVGGVSTRWKQTVAYEYTGSSFSAEEMQDKLCAIIRKCHDVGLNIKAIISDMGGQNRGFWKLMNINASRHSRIQNSIPHPVHANEKLYIMPDCVHIFKNIAAASDQWKEILY